MHRCWIIGNIYQGNVFYTYFKWKIVLRNQKCMLKILSILSKKITNIYEINVALFSKISSIMEFHKFIYNISVGLF